MAQTGAIATHLRRIMPATYDALVRASTFGTDLMQLHIDVVKNSLFGTIVNVTLEQTYSVSVLDYVAKVSAIRIIPPAIDFWGESPNSITASGTAESLSFPDRVAAMEKLLKELRASLAGKDLYLDGNEWKLSAGGSSLPQVSYEHPTYVTVDPWGMGPLYASGNELVPLPWGAA